MLRKPPVSICKLKDIREVVSIDFKEETKLQVSIAVLFMKFEKSLFEFYQ